MVPSHRLVYSLRRLCTATAANVAAAAPSLTATAPPTQESVIYVLKNLEKTPRKALSFLQTLTTNHSFFPSPQTLNLTLRILASKPETHPQFWSFLSSHPHHSLDSPTLAALLETFHNLNLPHSAKSLKQYQQNKTQSTSLDKIVNSATDLILKNGKWDNSLEQKLQELQLIIYEDLVARVIRDLRAQPDMALAFFRWAGKSVDNYKHGAIGYGAIVRVLAHSDTIAEFWGMVSEMGELGLWLDIDSYVKVNRQFLKFRMVEDAVRLYEVTMDGPYKPAVQDCGMLLRQISLSDAPDLALVYRVVGKYEEKGFSLSKVVYDGIHRSLTSVGRFGDAEEILWKMRLGGFEPDNITYSQLVFGLCKAKRLDDACKVLHEMEAGGCVPDVKTWTVLIQGHCNAGEVDKAVELSAMMIERNCEADADVLDVLVKGLCGTNRADGAYSLLNEMVDKAQLRPWQATYKYLIQELLKVRMLEEALKLLGAMKRIKFPPFADPFPAYIAKHGTTEDAREFLKALTVNNFPTPTAYLHVFKSFFDEGRYAEAQDLLFKCPHHIRKHADITKLFGSIKPENVA